MEDGPLGLIRALRDAIGEEGTLVMPTMTDGETVVRSRVDADFRHGHHRGDFLAAARCEAQHASWRFVRRDRTVGRAGLCAAAVVATRMDRRVLPGAYTNWAARCCCSALHTPRTRRCTSRKRLRTCRTRCRIPRGWRSMARCVRDDRGDRSLLSGFRKLDGWLRERGMQREGRVGERRRAPLCVARHRGVAVEKLAADPLLFLCPGSEACTECDAARASAESH